jgi:hypothetical protein
MLGRSGNLDQEYEEIQVSSLKISSNHKTHKLVNTEPLAQFWLSLPTGLPPVVALSKSVKGDLTQYLWKQNLAKLQIK